MKHLPTLLIIAGFCLGTLGAAGFDKQPEPAAWPLFLAGFVILGIGGVLSRRSRRSGVAGEAGPVTEKGSFHALIDAVRARVAELDDGRERLDPDDIRRSIDELLINEYFDLTSRSDDLIALVGFSDYARVWAGIATAERLLGRAWSMITDGHPDEGLAELPQARASLDGAAQAMASL